ncbi:hypothetical protein E2L08_11920 [Palleronia sediminis]|uniref:Lipopolysaccharide export system protein LptC n=1 Tax=Palleronia sediminis TaxID=2547833 RepID=A0A4R6A653_9RHOB|nr:LPS export ABC transporter periplasmic protein LptC [Palleronia sediminis]TDL78194.1 hypothetical protein E2L08_11920 [Palleronia sediminis]
MAVFDNRHSRWVRRLKIALPLAALVILSLLFLVADRRGSSTRLPYTQVEIDRIAAENRVGNPSYAAMTGDGDSIVIFADTVRRDGEAGMVADDLSGALAAANGDRFGLSAATGRLEEGTETMHLTGDVRLSAPTGYRVRSDALDLDIATGTLVSPGAVAATGPPGTLDAGGLRLERVGDDHLLTFTGGVKLVYDPTATGTD